MTVYRRQGSRTFFYDFWLSGVRYNRTTGLTTKADAETFEADLKKRLRRRRAGLEAEDAKDTPRFTDWADITLDWQTTRKKIKRPDEAENTLRMILAFWGSTPEKSEPVKEGEYRDLRLGDPVAAPELIEAFERWMDTRHLSGARKNHYRSACSMLYRVALLPQYRRVSGIRENPFRDLARDRTVRRTVTLSQAQITAWLAAAPTPVAVGIVLGLLSPALRLRNIVDLRRDQLSADRRFMTVPHKADRDTGRPLVVPTSPQVRRLVQALEKARPKDPYVVPLDGDERYWQFVKLVKRSVKAAGLPYGRTSADGVTFHTLRHTANTWLARWGVSGAERQQAGGHTTSAMSDWYAHLAGGDSGAALDLLSRRAPVVDAVLAKLRPRVSRQKSRRETRKRSA